MECCSRLSSRRSPEWETQSVLSISLWAFPLTFTYTILFLVLCCRQQLTLQVMRPTDQRPTASTPLPSLNLRISVSEG